MIDGYDLDRDLSAINRALKGDMPEAAIFYCGRALEVTSARAVSALNLDPGTQVFANLDMLERLSCIARPALYLGHSLRRLANDARHILRPLTNQDADFAALCLGPWLRWYMTDYFRGPKTSVADRSFGIHSALATGAVADTLDLLDRAESEDVSDRLLALAGEEVVKLPALASMVAEVLISDGHADDAQAVLTSALAHVPEDLRLNQLYALGCRRSGHPEEALTRLQKLTGKFSEDEETLGITAGALKSSWEKGQGPKDALARALRLYAKGFQVSRERNLYLGVNGAAIELWQQNPRAREHAAHIVDIFARRNAQLAESGIAVDNQRDYYDMVTEAEALLLAGDGARARDLYARAFARFAARKGDIAGTRTQANRSIALLGGEPIT
ncbi:MAG TPA: tetratricopeptide repeat-containing protein [Rhizomicrobium sp.]|nr:tetratricopeptide repeat-containing protein [Rhizomicrobium sp.]